MLQTISSDLSVCRQLRSEGQELLCDTKKCIHICCHIDPKISLKAQTYVAGAGSLAQAIKNSPQICSFQDWSVDIYIGTDWPWTDQNRSFLDDMMTRMAEDTAGLSYIDKVQRLSITVVGPALKDPVLMDGFGMRLIN